MLRPRRNASARPVIPPIHRPRPNQPMLPAGLPKARRTAVGSKVNRCHGPCSRCCMARADGPHAWRRGKSKAKSKASARCAARQVKVKGGLRSRLASPITSRRRTQPSEWSGWPLHVRCRAKTKVARHLPGPAKRPRPLAARPAHSAVASRPRTLHCAALRSRVLHSLSPCTVLIPAPCGHSARAGRPASSRPTAGRCRAAAARTAPCLARCRSVRPCT